MDVTPTRRHGTGSAGLSVAIVVSGLLAVGSPRVEAADPVIATVGDKTITGSDIAAQVQGPLLRLHTQIYTVKKRAADALINAHVLDQEAKRRGMSRAHLMQQEVADKVEPVGDAAVTAYYHANTERFGDKSLEDVREQLKAALAAQAKAERRAAFTAELRKAYSIDLKIAPPTVEVPIGDAPTRGPRDAPVTLVEFSDYQ